MLPLLMRALASSTKLDARADDDTIDRIGLAGASHGGGRALAAFLAHKERVHELYLLDPNPPLGGPVAWVEDVRDWAAAGGMARMFGGTYRLKEMLSIEKGLPRERASVRPSDWDYWATSELYRQALGYTDGPGGPDLTPAAEPPAPGSFSDSTGFRLEREDGGTVVVSVHDASGRKLATERLPGTAREVASVLGYARAWYANYFATKRHEALSPDLLRDAAPLTSAAEARLVFEFIRARRLIGRIRHKWAVIGGEGALDRGEGFRGNLQIALEESGY